ncbi:MAG: GAF domain-containing protein, partial [Acidimicrobiia bacterium]
HGPGIDALRQLQVFNVASLASAPAWPEFTELALAQGVRSTLAVPVTAGGRALGVLNLYSADVDAFAGREPIALRYASDAASMLAGSEWTVVVRRPGPVGTTDGPAVVPAAT